MKPPLVQLLLLLLFVAPLCAQDESRCGRFAEVLQTERKHVQFPVDWKFQLVCDGAVWQKLLEHVGLAGKTDRAFTALQLRTTFIFPPAYHEPLWLEVNYTLRHELGHFICRCGNEKVAVRIAQELVAGAKGMLADFGRHIPRESLELVKGDAPNETSHLRHRKTGEIFALINGRLTAPTLPPTTLTTIAGQ